MRTRILPLAGLLLLAAPALTARGAAADDRPAVVVAFKSLDGLIGDAKYIADLAGKAEEAKQAEAMLKNLLGDPKGLEGIDPKKPAGIYARINADNPQASEGVALIPITDENAFLSLLKRQDKIKVEDKAADGTYQVNVENVPVPLFIRFANKYAYVTAPAKSAIAKDRLIAPDKVLPAKTTSLASVVVHVDAIPQNYKDMAVSAVTENLAQEKKKDQPNETPAQKAFRQQSIDEAGALVKSILQDGSDLSVSIDVDQKAGVLSAQASFSGKSGSGLAQGIADLSGKKGIGASLVGQDSALNFVFDLGLPEKLRQSMSDAVDEAVKKGLAEAADKGQREAAERVVNALLPTVKAGELDGGFDLRGPGPKGLYTLVMGLKIQKGGDIEKVLRDAVKSASDKDKESLKLDVAKADGVSIHQVIPKDEGDANSKRIFGDKPEIYFAIRDDALLIAGGEGAMDALKGALAAKPSAGATMQMEIAMGRAAGLSNDANAAAAAEIAKKVFKPGVKDKVRIAIEGGKALTIKVSMDAPVVTFSAQVAEQQQKALQDLSK